MFYSKHQQITSIVSSLRIKLQRVDLEDVKNMFLKKPLIKFVIKYKFIILVYLIISGTFSGWMLTHKVNNIGKRFAFGLVNDAYLLPNNNILVRFKMIVGGATGGDFSSEWYFKNTIWKLGNKNNSTYGTHNGNEFYTSKDSSGVEQTRIANNGERLHLAPHFNCEMQVSGYGDVINSFDNSIPFATTYNYYKYRNNNMSSSVEYDKYNKLCDGVDILAVNDGSRAAKLYIKSKTTSNGSNYKEYIVPYPNIKYHKIHLTILKCIILPVAIVFDAVTGPIQFILMIYSLRFGGGM